MDFVMEEKKEGNLHISFLKDVVIQKQEGVQTNIKYGVKE